MWKRFTAWFKALFNRTMDKIEDPDMMLDQARRDMQGALVANKEKAVQALMQKNRLQMMLDEETKKSASLEQKAAMALRQENRELAKQFLREKASVDATLETLRASLATASETVEQVKVAIKRQEEEVRRKTAEALALKAQWKQAQIQTSITKALEGLTFENEYEGSFASARDRIKDKQAEASARQEMYAGSLAGKVMSMEDQAMDFTAEEELRKLEEKMGMGAPKIQATATTSVGEDSVEDQLKQLEQRLGQNPPSNS